MADYYFPEVNTNGQFTDPKVNTYIETLAKSALATALAAKRGVEPTELGTEHLDTVVVPDVYSQSSNLEATIETGYPFTRAGILIVDRSASKSMVWQTYLPHTPSVTTAQREFRRTCYQGNWTAWTEIQTMAWESQALTTENLDTVTAPRVYSQSTNTGATLELNYPVKWAGILEVTANNSRNIVRQVYRPYSHSLVPPGETWTRSLYNTTWSAWARSDAGAIIPSGGTANQVLTAGTNGNLQWGPVISSSSSTLTGPGRPDTPSTTGGIITGNEPVGTEYRSTDGASVGAWIWMKRPGNVWAVTDGDTGWRALGRWSGGQVTEGNVPPSIGPVSTVSGGIFLRRVNSVVTLSVVEGVALQANPEIPLIPGFRGNNGSPYPAIPLYYRLPGGTEAMGNIDVGAALYRLRVPKGAILASYGSGGYGVQGDWTTGYTDWPTTLPGTSA